MEEKRGLKKEKVGTVVSNKMEKSVVVSVVENIRHTQYGKFVKKTFKFLAHDEKKECGVGDTVSIMESRPLSARKRWRVSKILEKAI